MNVPLYETIEFILNDIEQNELNLDIPTSVLEKLLSIYTDEVTLWFQWKPLMPIDVVAM